MFEHEPIEMIRQKAIDYLYRHPCMKFVDDYYRSHGPFERMDVKTVEDALAEKMIWAMNLTEPSGAYSNDTHERFDGQPHAVNRWVMATLMAEAVPYVWDTEIFKSVIGSPLPRHTIQGLLPFEAVWFSFRDRLPMSIDENDTVGKAAADGILATQLSQCISFTLLGMYEDEPKPVCVTMQIPKGAIYPDFFADDPILLEQVSYLLAALSFINSPHIVLDRKHPNRNTRRRVGMIGEIKESEVVRFITLRAPLYKRDPRQSYSEIDWKFRWLVSAHHRAQWCPSTKDHKLIWITPYVKGPEDAPMKTRAYKVIQ